MPTFDIRNLADFREPRFLCVKCRGLLLSAPMPDKGANPRCPICAVEYRPSKAYGVWGVGDYLKSRDCTIHFDNLLRQCIDLARTTVFSAAPSWEKIEQPPLNNLLEALSLAKAFVHFMSFGISEFFIGALKIVAQRVPVRGIVSNVDERTLDELTTFAEDAPYGNFEIKHFLRDGAWREAPHQKLIVVDGLLAFKGAANLTLMGWRKAAKGLDHVEVVTKTEEIVELHNRLFARVWADRSDLGPAIDMGVF